MSTRIDWQREKCAVLIVTHRRPNQVKTIKSLRQQGYTGPIYLIVDNEDPTLKEYQARFGDKVIVFSKYDYLPVTDAGIQPTLKSVVYARNASFDIAEGLGLDWFIELDDDYQSWNWRFDGQLRLLYPERKIHSLDRVFYALLEFYRSTPLKALCIAQSGDFIGAPNNEKCQKIMGWRKAMNMYILSPHRRFQFIGELNDDVNAYVVWGNQGQLFLTINQVFVRQGRTQQQPGGLTDLYHKFGTYVKSAMTVIMAPSCVRIAAIGPTAPRVHHEVIWNQAVPKIIREAWRKF